MLQTSLPTGRVVKKKHFAEDEMIKKRKLYRTTNLDSIHIWKGFTFARQQSRAFYGESWRESFFILRFLRMKGMNSFNFLIFRFHFYSQSYQFFCSGLDKLYHKDEFVNLPPRHFLSYNLM